MHPTTTVLRLLQGSDTPHPTEVLTNAAHKPESSLHCGLRGAHPQKWHEAPHTHVELHRLMYTLKKDNEISAKCRRHRIISGNSTTKVPHDALTMTAA